MWFRQVCTAAVVLVCLGAVATEALAQPWERWDNRRDRRGDWRDQEWVELGCREVGFHVDRDVIRVGRREGRFRAIRLKAFGNVVYMYDLTVIYTNGEPDRLPVREEIIPDRRTRPLELKGWQRSIHQINMVYRAEPNFRGRRATICVEGLI